MEFKDLKKGMRLVFTCQGTGSLAYCNEVDHKNKTFKVSVPDCKSGVGFPFTLVLKEMEDLKFLEPVNTGKAEEDVEVKDKDIAYTCTINLTDTHLEIEMKDANGGRYRYHTPLMAEEIEQCPQYVKEFIEYILKNKK